MIDLGLVSGRAASAMKKVEKNIPLDAIDTDSLSKIEELLRASAESVQFFDSGGQSGMLPADSLAPQVDTAIEVAMHDPIDVDPAELSKSLSSLADSIGQVVESIHVDIAGLLSDYFTRLSHSVLRDTASVGETTGRL